MAAAGPIRYIWNGTDPHEGHINGIPARDLTQDDYDALDKDQQKAVRTSDLYQAPPEPDPVPARLARGPALATTDEKKD